MYVVIYTDGSCKPNPGMSGWGAHGYSYIGIANKKSIINEHAITTDGYILKDQIKDDVKFVSPVYYYDFSVFSSKDGSNNEAELSAIIGILNYFKEKEISGISIKTDSEYVIRGISINLPLWKENNWTSTTDKETALISLWKELDALLVQYKESNINIELVWVKSRKDYGNNIADQLAKIAVNVGNFYADYSEIPAKEYNKFQYLKHPLLCFKKLCFSTETQLDNGKYLIVEPGDGLGSFGEKHAEATYAVVHLAKSDSIIELIKTKHRKHTSNSGYTVIGHLDTIFHKNIYSYIYKYKEGCLIPTVSRKRFGITSLNFIDGKELTTEIIPAGLAFVGMTILEHLNNILLGYRTKTLNTDLENNGYLVLDITDELYDNNKLKPNINNSIKYIQVHKTIDVYSNRKQISPHLMFGKDLPHRNTLKAIDDGNSVVKLVLWIESNVLMRYVTIVATDGGVGVWSNHHSNYIFLNTLGDGT